MLEPIDEFPGDFFAIVSLIPVTRLQEAAARAAAAGVAHRTEVAMGEDPHEAIIAAARTHGCDLVAMASHGRRGVKALVLGSVTAKVLTHSEIPVLVYRRPAQ